MKNISEHTIYQNRSHDLSVQESKLKTFFFHFSEPEVEEPEKPSKLSLGYQEKKLKLKFYARGGMI